MRETLLAFLHDTTLAVGVVNGVHTLFSPGGGVLSGCVESRAGREGRLRGLAPWPTPGTLHWEGIGGRGRALMDVCMVG